METETETAIPTATETVGTEAASARRDLARRGVTPVRLAGRSMHPTLPEGRLLLVGRSERCSPGDVGLLDVDGGLLLHRIVGRFGDRLIHVGDGSTRWGVAGTDAVIGRADAPRGVVPPPGAHAALLAGRLGTVLERIGIPRGILRLLIRPLR